MSWAADDVLSIVTIITLLGIVVGDRILGWLKTRGVDLTKLSEMYELVYDTHQVSQELLKQLENSTLEDAIKILATNIGTQTELLREMVNQNKLNREEHRLFLDQLSRIKK